MKKIFSLGFIIVFIFNIITVEATAKISVWTENEIKEAVELGYVLEELQDDYQKISSIQK